jgi:hypothetical protein
MRFVYGEVVTITEGDMETRVGYDELFFFINKEFKLKGEWTDLHNLLY